MKATSKSPANPQQQATAIAERARRGWEDYLRTWDEATQQMEALSEKLADAQQELLAPGVDVSDLGAIPDTRRFDSPACHALQLLVEHVQRERIAEQ